MHLDCTSPFDVSFVTDATADATITTIANGNRGMLYSHNNRIVGAYFVCTICSSLFIKTEKNYE